MEPNTVEHETGTLGDGLLPSYEGSSLPTLIGSSLSSVDNRLSPTQEFEDKTGLLMVSSCSTAARTAWNLSSAEGTPFLQSSRCDEDIQQLEKNDAATSITGEEEVLTAVPLHPPFLSSPINSNNNSNAVVGAQYSAAAAAAADCPPEQQHYQQQVQQVHSIPRSRPKLCSKHPPVEVSLDGRELWDEFYSRGTEMIVNRAGRRMFPGFSVTISGLKPKAKYSMKLDVVLADNHRFKFLNARWLAVGNAEPQPPSTIYVHPDSPNTGSFWMRHGISFRKLKITNNKDKPGQNALLHSMHKYFLRLLVDEEKKAPPGEPKLPAKNILTQDFIETSFIAVTAYQNEEVTQLKITNNPFAKAFRENAADMDWETAQALYGPASHGYLASSPGFPSPGSCMMTSPSSQWPLQSPLLSPHPMTPSLNTLHPHIMSPLSSYSPSGSPQVPHSMSGTAQYFQWPQQSRQTSQYSPLAPPPPPPPPPPPLPPAAAAAPPTPGYYQQAVPGSLDTSPAPYFAGQSSMPQLPDFDSVFTPTVVSSQS